MTLDKFKERNIEEHDVIGIVLDNARYCGCFIKHGLHFTKPQITINLLNNHNRALTMPLAAVLDVEVFKKGFFV